MTGNGKRNVLIMGAAGRDFHDFNVFWRTHPNYHVVAFTAAQIPDIDGRVYPSELAGPDNETPSPEEKTAFLNQTNAWAENFARENLNEGSHEEPDIAT